MAIPSTARDGYRLPTREPGKTGMAITRVGLGAWAIEGTEWGPQNDETSIRAIRHALERGISWIDTAPIYGFGHSEESVRRALQGMPSAERPCVFTKCSLVRDPGNREAPPLRVGSAPGLRRKRDDSRRRLGVERIDLYPMHRLAEALKPVTARHDVPVAAVAVAWTLASPGVTGAGDGPALPFES